MEVWGREQEQEDRDRRAQAQGRAQHREGEAQGTERAQAQERQESEAHKTIEPRWHTGHRDRRQETGMQAQEGDRKGAYRQVQSNRTPVGT